ncbi:bifunctional 3-phosphoshikimate 1-carboxyvinyltransferase/cytidylate kinase [Verminephrobacter eiseniae]|uniref:bifunctional 3-phosphoshikimate 1-carboxyvinyltransferase/cytidylate kinase n=1 Tax=Verminephrobacter eiseniae TaxID=364317 RepID=UPI002238B1FD|nr:bifunctional 3-phosphoshikimate 1-carboxyvinyltransferase/cytidylate kinase [Verminephrobacter eiseniae]MCW5231562.1 bifunctional 3-phosphoshikimate 1-carboxyvinyltransferase/cytidylate kinase [Verminephrobacter eiseniae]MCW5293291.1 bifunctional 3-phosphoshikimate 1-carboxyvinyltransferase/cytidylate kinase [Verminephrobacter eiseniae]MCW8186967.1 bifunctional 3-phosphoshikimate 1-carboxyvinyltransferase/cytidylate kinase [Verminephrobacter eiseniae]MCW8225353.1 bifunctional 3-phosphoshikim
MYSTAFIDLPALDAAAGEVRLPGSKSISNRVLLLAALSNGTTTVHQLLASDDTRVMLDALRQIGCAVDEAGSSVHITGLGGRAPRAPAKLFLGNAGTAMRPLTAALALLGGEFELSGVARMHQRPIGDLVDALRQLGCRIDYLGNDGYPPLRIAHAACAPAPDVPALVPGVPPLALAEPIRVRGDVSSQFLTALLMALPLAAGRQSIVIEVLGELISKPYIAITLELLARFGIVVERQGWQRFTIAAGSRYQSPGSIHVEADASSASYFIALGAIASGAGGPNGAQGIRIAGLGLDSIQGDIRFVEAARAMGAVVTGGPHWLHVQRGAPGQGWPLKAIDIDCNHIPDAAMTLAVMALYAQGSSRLRNIASWRVKETDRIAAMAAGLRQLGASVEEGADFIRITPPPRTEDWKAASIDTHDDHRVAMCFALAAFNPAGLPIRIQDPKCVAKTFPDYFEALFSVAQLAAERIPVICIDGPTASGKGTLAAALARQLGYRFLDSGALYRITALVALRSGLRIDAGHEERIAALARTLPVRFESDRVLLGSDDLTEAIRSEEVGMNASRVSALPAVRAALVALQHSFRRLPGLVADGRDMGTVIFPAAALKVYLTASLACRAERRYKQLISKGFSANIADLCADLQERDARDGTRSVAPLKPAQDALLLDNSCQTMDQTVALVLAWWQERQFGAVFAPGRQPGAVTAPG